MPSSPEDGLPALSARALADGSITQPELDKLNQAGHGEDAIASRVLQACGNKLLTSQELLPFMSEQCGWMTTIVWHGPIWPWFTSSLATP